MSQDVGMEIKIGEKEERKREKKFKIWIFMMEKKVLTNKNCCYKMEISTYAMTPNPLTSDTGPLQSSVSVWWVSWEGNMPPPLSPSSPPDSNTSLLALDQFRLISSKYEIIKAEHKAIIDSVPDALNQHNRSVLVKTFPTIINNTTIA